MKQSDNSPKRPVLHPDVFGATCAILLIRLWLGIRCLQAGIEKYAGTKLISVPVIIDGKPDPNGTEVTIEMKAYALQNYSGIPSGLSDKFKYEPLLNDFFLGIYNQSLGPLLIVLGLFVLLGLATRLSLLTMGLVYTSLTYGLILINQPSGIAWLGTHIILVAVALLFAGYNRFELGHLLARRSELQWLRHK